MTRFRKGAASSFLIVLTACFAVMAQGDRPKDTSPHTSGFEMVNGVRLHYLDWGGKGPALLFIAGIGNTAHTFDEIAPRFTDRFHVLGLTRRGFGESDKPATGYDIATLTEDIRGFLDRMKIDRVDLIGHSAGGDELIEFAVKYPRRTLKLVFLDAAYDRREVPGLAARDPLPEPEPPAGSITASYIKSLSEYEPLYKKIKAPALSYYAIFETHWAIKPDADEATRKKAQDFVEKEMQPYQFRNAERFRKEVKHGRVIVLRGTNHYFFKDPKQRDAVVDQIRAFLLNK